MQLHNIALIALVIFLWALGAIILAALISAREPRIIEVHHYHVLDCDGTAIECTPEQFEALASSVPAEMK